MSKIFKFCCLIFLKFFHEQNLKLCFLTFFHGYDLVILFPGMSGKNPWVRFPILLLDIFEQFPWVTFLENLVSWNFWILSTDTICKCDALAFLKQFSMSTVKFSNFTSWIYWFFSMNKISKTLLPDFFMFWGKDLKSPWQKKWEEIWNLKSFSWKFWHEYLKSFSAKMCVLDLKSLGWKK